VAALRSHVLVDSENTEGETVKDMKRLVLATVRFTLRGCDMEVRK